MERQDDLPKYFRVIRHHGRWTIELINRLFMPMGVASYNQQPVYYETRDQAVKAARKRGLDPLPQHH